MNKLGLVLFLLFNFQIANTQISGPEPPPGTLCPGPQPPPPSGGPCEMCNYLMEWNIYTCEYVEGIAYEECVEANCPPLVPLSLPILILFPFSLLLGGYYLSKNHKKRPLEN